MCFVRFAISSKWYIHSLFHSSIQLNGLFVFHLLRIQINRNIFLHSFESKSAAFSLFLFLVFVHVNHFLYSMSCNLLLFIISNIHICICICILLYMCAEFFQSFNINIGTGIQLYFYQDTFNIYLCQFFFLHVLLTLSLFHTFRNIWISL